MNKDEYIIINKTAIQQIDKLIKEANVGKTITSINSQMADSLIRFKEQLLSQSTPLIPEIEKAFNAGGAYTLGSYKEFTQTHPDKTEYISNLKLNI